MDHQTYHESVENVIGRFADKPVRWQPDKTKDWDWTKRYRLCSKNLRL